MSNLDRTGQALLERIAAHHEAGLFADVPEVSATDSNDTLTITIDAATRVVDVRVLDIGRLRMPDALVGAVLDAFALADAGRALAALESHGALEEYLARAGAALEIPAAAPEPPDVGRDARERRPVPSPGDDTQPEPGRSANGYLSARRNENGRLAGVEVDPEWLSAATPEHLERALVQACRFETEV